MSLATDERSAISDTFQQSGPDRPTLCAGWTTRRLLAHMLVRERQPLAMPGIVIPALASITEHAMDGYNDTPWDQMITELRDGPPLWSPYRIGSVDDFVNGGEFFVHHEDARRGEPGWAPRAPDITRDEQLWALMRRAGRMFYRRSPVGVVLRRPAGAEQVVKTGQGVVTIVGEPSELVLHAFGRDAAWVTIEGLPADVEALAGASRGL